MNCEVDMSFKCRLHSVSDHSQLSLTERQSVWWSNVRQKLEASSDESRHSQKQMAMWLPCEASITSHSVAKNLKYPEQHCIYNVTSIAPQSDWCPCTPRMVQLITLHKSCTHTFISAPVLWWFSLRLEPGRHITHNLLEDLIDQSAVGSTLIMIY